MRRILFSALLITMCALSKSLDAQTVVSLHHSNGQITNYYQTDGLQKAYADAVDGDTIILPGATFAPPSKIEKQLTIFGTGHYNSAESPTGKSFINGNVVFDNGVDYFHIEGVHIIGSVNVASGATVSNITVKRCYISAGVSFTSTGAPSTNISFIESVISSTINLSNALGVGIHNSILGGSIHSSEGNTFSNNIFFYTSSPVSYSNNNTFTHNIFRVSNNTSLISASVGNKFFYNVIEATAPNYGTGAQAENNWTGVNFQSMFLNQDGTAFSYNDNYHLANPETYVDNNDTKVGIYGGVFPYKADAIPVIPNIKSSTISPTTNAEGKLEVNIEVEAQDN